MWPYDELAKCQRVEWISASRRQHCNSKNVDMCQIQEPVKRVSQSGREDHLTGGGELRKNLNKCLWSMEHSLRFVWSEKVKISNFWFTSEIYRLEVVVSLLSDCWYPVSKHLGISAILPKNSMCVYSSLCRPGEGSDMNQKLSIFYIKKIIILCVAGEGSTLGWLSISFSDIFDPWRSCFLTL